MATQTQTVTQTCSVPRRLSCGHFCTGRCALKSTPMPYAPQQIAGFSKDQLDAIGLGRAGIGAYQPYMQAATQAAAQSGAFNQPGAVSQFMNPYEQAVIDQSMQDIARSGQMQQNQLKHKPQVRGPLADLVRALHKGNSLVILWISRLEPQRS